MVSFCSNCRTQIVAGQPVVVTSESGTTSHVVCPTVVWAVSETSGPLSFSPQPYASLELVKAAVEEQIEKSVFSATSQWKPGGPKDGFSLDNASHHCQVNDGSISGQIKVEVFKVFQDGI